jgi:hypothetical protein
MSVANDQPTAVNRRTTRSTRTRSPPCSVLGCFRWRMSIHARCEQRTDSEEHKHSIQLSGVREAYRSGVKPHRTTTAVRGTQRAEKHRGGPPSPRCLPSRPSGSGIRDQTAGKTPRSRMHGRAGGETADQPRWPTISSRRFPVSGQFSPWSSFTRLATSTASRRSGGQARPHNWTTTRRDVFR